MAAETVIQCLYVLLSLASTWAQICTSCPGDMRTSSEVWGICQSRGGQVNGRCCMHGASNEIIGLDLWNCSLSLLDPAINLTDAMEVIDISQNPLQDLPKEIFRGLTGLWYIALPLNLSCPGGEDAWRMVNTTSGARICRYQSGCNSSTELTLLCPENSMCMPDGPGYTECVCADGFTGYKCMREGTFPIIMFFGILGAVTVSLSFLLWFTQRRKAKTQ
ncbi:all-trans retinoic acid-induced differentiation factor [Pelodytes ibericus]